MAHNRAESHEIAIEDSGALRQSKLRPHNENESKPFPEAKVQASYDKARKALVVSIEEGPRYLYGDIEFTGVVTEFDTQLHDYLTQWRPKKTRLYDLNQATPQKIPTTTKESGKSEPYWHVDHPASFYERDLKGLQWVIRDKFEQLGYYNVAFTIKLRPLADGKVNLIVAVQQLGRPAVLQQINISGIKNNSREDVIKFLGLHDGQKLNSEVTTNAREKLRRSARFVKQEVKVVPSPNNDSNYVAGLEQSPKSVSALTSLSWMLATCPRAEHRDGRKAIEYATRLCELTEWKHYNALDTLAAAFAELGDFPKAVSTIEIAIELAPDEMKDDLKERLKLYREQEPYRAPEGVPVIRPIPLIP